MPWYAMRGYAMLYGIALFWTAGYSRDIPDRNPLRSLMIIATRRVPLAEYHTPNTTQDTIMLRYDSMKSGIASHRMELTFHIALHNFVGHLMTQSYISKGIWRQGIGSFCKEFLCVNTMPCRHTPLLVHFWLWRSIVRMILRCAAEERLVWVASQVFT